MREFQESKLFTDSLNFGLRNDPNKMLNKPGMESCVNMKPKKDSGSVTMEQYEQPFPNRDITWPFPQLIKGSGITLLADETTIYRVDENGWGLTQLSFRNVRDSTTDLVVPAGGSWQFADHYDSWILTNGVVTLYASDGFTLLGNINLPYMYHNTPYKAATSYKGSTLLGGFNKGSFWNDDWKATWEVWAANFPGSVSKFIDGIDKNFVLWSSIGGNLLWLFDEEVGSHSLVPSTAGGTDTGYDTGASSQFKGSYIFDLFKEGTLGWAPMTFKGCVMNIKVLGESSIVYGEDGISLMNRTVSPTTTMGVRSILDEVGIVSRSAVGGNNFVHLFVGSDGQLWKIEANNTIPKPLGYEEFIKPMTNGKDGEIMIAYDNSEDEFIISNSKVSYTLTSAGLGQGSQMITSAVNKDKLYVVSRNSGLGRVEFITNPFDLNLRAIKTMQSVELGASGYENSFVSFYYKSEGFNRFRKSPWVPINSMGTCVPMISGTEFKMAFYSVGLDMDMDYITLRWKLSDRRFIRGVYAS